VVKQHKYFYEQSKFIRTFEHNRRQEILK